MTTSTAGLPLRLLPGPQLLLDDLLIEDRHHLSRVLQHPVKDAANPVIVNDQPWDEGYQHARCVIWDEQLGRFRAWISAVYRSRHKATKGAEPYQALAYAESDDGIHWVKPLFDFCEVNGHRKTNILHWGSGKPILNPVAADAEHRFLAAGLYFRDHESGLRSDGVNLLHSADGLQWAMDGDKHLLDYHSDTKNQLVWDARHERWLLYCRPIINASGRAGHGDFRRRMCVMVSDDLRDWSYPQTVFYPDENDAPDIDHAQVFSYGSHLLMLYAAMDSPTTGRMHMRLASSGDGFHWTPFHTREDFIPLGPAGSFDAGIVGSASAPVRKDGNLLIYYNAMNLGQREGATAVPPAVGTIGLAKLPADRFVAQRAGDEDGWLLTKQFLLEGSKLHVNCATRESGFVRVEVVQQPRRDGHVDYYLNEHARKAYTHAYDDFSLEQCTPVTGDHVAAPVAWQGRDLSSLVGRPIYLRFQIRSADLFSFTITNE